MAQKTILVADDSENIRKVVQLGFESLDYRVLTAADGKEALEVARRERPDLVILDVMMPEMNGYDVCAAIKKDPVLHDTPVVMLTAKNLEEDKYWGRELGADEYVTKPYDPEDLERAVERIFALRERGEGYHPLTRLPDWRAVRHEADQRRRRGEPCVVVACSFVAEPFETYRMKYGNIKADSVTQQLGQIIAAAVRKETEAAGFVGHGGDNVFYLILPPGSKEPVQRSVDAQFVAAVRFFYHDEDVERGGVAVPGAGGGVTVPLLSLSWRELDPGTMG